jgi:predicted O-linked N-acetylglucosamine transferase (SPINDLY family)
MRSITNRSLFAIVVLSSAGALTALDAIQVNLPTVFSSFGSTVSSRMTHALYERMGLIELGATSAEDYVNRAVRLGTDSAHRNAVRAQLADRKDRLYEDHSAVRHFEAWIDEAVNKKVVEAIQAQAVTEQ